jgi:flagellar hook protein FlgE
MMRSLYSAVSGLKNQQTAMDVIGNNVANVNTTGFKSSQVLFQDIFSQTVSNASAPTQNSGGVNAKQIGLGVTTAAVATDMTEGSTQSTGKTLDFAISGEGFFVVKASDGSYYYTRNGNFTVDSEGYLVTQNGDYVMGKTGTGTITPTSPTTSFALKNSATSLSASGTLYTTTSTGSVTLATPVIASTAAQTELAKTGYDGTYSITTTAAVSPATGYVWTATNGTKTLYGTLSGSTITFNTNATAASGTDLFSITLTDGTSGAAAVQAGTLKSAFTIKTKSSELVTTGLDDDNSNLSLDSLSKIQLTGTIGSDSPYGTNYYGSYNQNYTIDKYGTVTAYRNEDDGTTTKVTLARLGLATFANSSGLEKNGDSSYKVSNNSGDPTVNFVGVDCGTASSGVLEMSNVQLSSEMTNMIVTQRAFQANSRVITTSDSMLEELVNLKRS